MVSLHDIHQAAESASKDREIARLRRRIDKLEMALFNEIEDSFDYEWPPYWVRLIGGKRRLAAIEAALKEGKP